MTTKKLVIVEDNNDLRELIRLTLEFSDYELYEADDSDGALRIIQAIRPDVVLLDIMLPGHIDGLDLCRIIKDTQSLKHTQVIMVSAKGQAVDLRQADKAGADDYLVKPFSPLKLIQMLQ